MAQEVPAPQPSQIAPLTHDIYVEGHLVRTIAGAAKYRVVFGVAIFVDEAENVVEVFSGGPTIEVKHHDETAMPHYENPATGPDGI